MNTNPTVYTTTNPMATGMPVQAGAAPIYTTNNANPTGTNDPTHPPSAIKGNVTSMMGKLQHNPTKEHDGNVMIANAAEQKANRFDAKALQWESKGNTTKAQKNREKAARYRQKAVAKLNQPLSSANHPRAVGTTGTTGLTGSSLKSDKASRCEAKALEYERKGNLAKAQRNRERAWRIREKHSVPHPVGAQHPSTYAAYTQNMTTPVTTVPVTTARTY